MKNALWLVAIISLLANAGVDAAQVVPAPAATPLPCYPWSGPNPNHTTVSNNVACSSIPKTRTVTVNVQPVPDKTPCIGVLNIVLKQPFIVPGKTKKDPVTVFVSKNSKGQNDQVFLASLDQLRAIAACVLTAPSPSPAPSK